MSEYRIRPIIRMKSVIANGHGPMNAVAKLFESQLKPVPREEWYKDGKINPQWIKIRGPLYEIKFLVTNTKTLEKWVVEADEPKFSLTKEV